MQFSKRIRITWHEFRFIFTLNINDMHATWKIIWGQYFLQAKVSTKGLVHVSLVQVRKQSTRRSDRKRCDLRRGRPLAACHTTFCRGSFFIDWYT